MPRRCSDWICSCTEAETQRPPGSASDSRRAATFTPVRFVPTEGPYRGRLCEGVRIQRRPGATRPGEIGLALALALRRRYPVQFRIDAIRASIGSREVADMLDAGRPLGDIERVVETRSVAFARERAAFLLY